MWALATFPNAGTCSATRSWRGRFRERARYRATPAAVMSVVRYNRRLFASLFRNLRNSEGGVVGGTASCFRVQGLLTAAFILPCLDDSLVQRRVQEPNNAPLACPGIVCKPQNVSPNNRLLLLACVRRGLFAGTTAACALSYCLASRLAVLGTRNLPVSLSLRGFMFSCISRATVPQLQ